MLLVGACGACWPRAALLAVTLLGPALALGCAKPKSATTPSSASLGLGAVREGRGAGPDLALIPQPSGELLQLSLWIDAGARDAEPPQVATLSAWLAAEAAGGEVQAQALPDGIELSLPCKRAELGACLGRLERGLSARRVDPARVKVLLSRLVETRRLADARDPGRAADRLALEALFGDDEAGGLFPLGRAQDDAQLEAGRIAEFLAQHFGPNRALLVAAGALDADTFEEATAAAFGRAPPATHARDSDRPQPEAEGGVAVEIASATQLSLVLAAPALGDAYAAAAALRARLERDREALGLRAGVRGHVFELRGAALALLRVETSAATAAARAAAHELERLQVEGLTHATPRVAAQDLPALARTLGTRWIAHVAQPTAPARLALGIGALVAGGRADKLSLADPDAALREAAHEQLEQAFEAGRALANPKLHGAIESDSAAVTLDNGARISLHARAGEQVAVAVRFARGAAFEPPSLHGRSALLATLMATACAGLAPEQLRERLRELGAELQPRVDADSFGVALVAPATHWQAALALALECALRPSLERRHLSTARLRLVQRIGPPAGAGELAAAAAEQLWPSAPGALAPWGSTARQAGVSLASVRELWQHSRRGPALSIAVVGALPLAQALPFAARRIAELDAAQAQAVKPAAPSLVQTRSVLDQPTLGLAVWRVQGADADAAGALAFAALMRAALGQVPDVSASWHDGGVVAGPPGGAWAAVALSGAPEPLALAASALRDAARAISPASLERAADQAVVQAERSAAAARANPLSEAETLARAAFRTPPAARSAEQARALAARLARAEPVWLPLR